MAIIYIAGPMTGLKDFNRDSFYLAELACLPTDWTRYESQLLAEVWGALNVAYIANKEAGQ